MFNGNIEDAMESMFKLERVISIDVNKENFDILASVIYKKGKDLGAHYDN
ncbi:MAG TPA: hypothetical protein VJL78_03105 [Candidatus Nitrosocosmicus sp.]|nr:hypothetical protein [Candidatus Nitrosocosmicus sp.]